MIRNISSHHLSFSRAASNQTMKPTAPWRENFSVFATTPCPWLISFSLDAVSALRKLSLSGILGIAFGVLGNMFTIAFWTWVVLSTHPYADARYLIEAVVPGLVVLLTFVFLFPLGFLALLEPGKRILGLIIILLSLTSFPVGFVVLHTLSSWRHITLIP
jgi:hypothetical protein